MPLPSKIQADMTYTALWREEDGQNEMDIDKFTNCVITNQEERSTWLKGRNDKMKDIVL